MEHSGVLSRLIQSRLITNRIANRVLKHNHQYDSAIMALVGLRLISESKLQQFLCEQYNVLALDEADFDLAHVAQLTEQLIVFKDLSYLPVKMTHDQVLVVAYWPPEMNHLEQLELAVSRAIQPFIVTVSRYIAIKARLAGLFESNEHRAIQPNASVLASQGDSHIAQLLDTIVAQCTALDCSDIHFEPFTDTFRIRGRIDGVLIVINELTISTGTKIVARLKLLANLDIAEKRRAQDGHWQTQGELQFRVSTLPTCSGEKVVLRRVTQQAFTALDSLGFTHRQLAVFNNALGDPSGLILVTGPTGAGKSLTLYSALLQLNSTTCNISTVEDPVELHLPGINQTAVNPEIGLDFSDCLRVLLRQDPDVIMVGEIRDEKTANMAIRAAQTGHLVLSTLHCSSALQAFERLQNLGIDLFSLVNSIRLVVAQRLVRKTCLACALLTPSEQSHCSECAGTRYKGRVGVFELIEMSENLKQGLLEGVPIKSLHKGLFNNDNPDLLDAALLKLASKVTDIEELNRVFGSDLAMRNAFDG